LSLSDSPVLAQHGLFSFFLFFEKAAKKGLNEVLGHGEAFVPA
jgi:hypothetical protein